MIRFLAASSLIFAMAVSLEAADWPQFLGPKRDNTTPEEVAPWKGELKALWKMPVGEAHSSPVVADGIVYIFAHPKGGNTDSLSAFDAKTGELKWKNEYDRIPFTSQFGDGPGSTPVVRSGKVYTFGSTGILACWNTKTGDIVWKVDTSKEFKPSNLRFGISTSPIMIGEDKVVVMVGGKGAGVVAFDVKNGKTVWQATDDPPSYSSPIFADKQLIFLTGSNLLGLSTAGKELWSIPFKDLLNESSTTPIMLGDMAIASSVTAGTIAVRVSEKDGKYSTEKVWDNKALTCYFSTPVPSGDYLYMINGALLAKSITLRCVEAKTGKLAWEKKNVGRYHAAILRCGPEGKERMLMLDDNGFLTLFEVNPKEYKELAKSKVCGLTWAHPALVDNNLYLRDEKELICIPLSK
ncbi:MAG TPA: PQQ-binding-like beta-propeller repeat protein [Gemmata sp.]|jgi:outer membrane protein assembly factor BamB|nr:PQQ-binding-like beta-propeller repeat protein [Gemmata sp.]